MRKRTQRGLTLMELMIVVAIMGILAAFVLPKLFDLQSRAMQKSINAAISEIMSRVNQRFASQLLDGVIVANVDYSEGSVGTNLGQYFDITNWGWGAGSTKVSFDVTYYPKPNDHTLNPATISAFVDLPQTGE